jgi:hypothetical protein
MNNFASTNEHDINSPEENQIISMLKNEENQDIDVEKAGIRAVSDFNPFNRTLFRYSKKITKLNYNGTCIGCSGGAGNPWSVHCQKRNQRTTQSRAKMTTDKTKQTKLTIYFDRLRQ